MTINTACKELAARIFGSPERDRLTGAIAETRTDLAHQIGGKASSEWKLAAEEYLKQAKTYLDDWNFQQGWVSLMAAQRAMLSNPNDPDRLRRTAITLRREAEKVTGWRAKAIEDFICGPKGKLLDGLAKVDGKPITPSLCQRVIDAVALRDDHASTDYLKILLRRRSLIQLFLVLLVGIIACALLSALHVLPSPFDAARQVAAVIIFGMLGAALSVGQGLLAANLSAKIPAQQIGSVVVWMRPAIGAVAALIAYALIHANTKIQILNAMLFDPSDFSVIAVIAFVAGYSERFIVGAIEKISQLSDKDKDKEKNKSKDKGS